VPRLVVLIAVLLAWAPSAGAATATAPWPPRTGPGHLFAHYGEEHWNDIDGESVLTRLVDGVVRYRPDLVTMSGDKTDDGTTEKLEKWRDIMAAYDRAGIPYMAGVGNHDGKQATPEPITDAAAGSTPLRDVTFYKQVFAGRPYPMGDAAPYANAAMAPRARPADDPAGASTHYFVDYGNVRWIFIDNSCYGIVNCDPLQNGPDGSGRSQYQYLRDLAGEAGGQGKLVFVVMHMPTRDPRDQEQSYYTSVSHTMGKGGSPDNQQFEQEAEAAGVDGVFLGHIKGQFLYRGQADIPYYIDGGAGGELYSGGPIGVDHGYWYGWRLLRVDAGKVQTDVIPVIVPGGIRVEGPQRLLPGAAAVHYEAFARQPATKSKRAIIEALELRDPDPLPKSTMLALPPWLVWLAPLLLIPVLALVARAVPRPARVLVVAALGGVAMTAAVASAQHSVPTSTPRESLPNPARIFTSGNPLVLAPVASKTDDARRDARTQTEDGAFRPVCPGRTTVRVTSGFEETATPVTVASGPGTILRSVRRGRGRTVATVNLAQGAIVEARLRRAGRTIQTFAPTCRTAGKSTLRARRTPPRGATLEVQIRSDRKPSFRRIRF
jgi:hypothetical protein